MPTNMDAPLWPLPGGERLVDATPQGHWNTTFVAGLRSQISSPVLSSIGL
jgi:hypothetical protein